jgi:hypothetical protein
MFTACVMNIISFENAYSLYPKETFENRRSLICESAGPRQEIARQKYASRGWEFFTSVSHKDKKDLRSSLRRGNRWIGDRFCWIISLSCEGLDLSRCSHPHFDLPVHDCLGLHTWRLNYLSEPKMCFKILELPIFKTSYTAGNRALLKFLCPMIKEISERLQREERNDDEREL